MPIEERGCEDVEQSLKRLNRRGVAEVSVASPNACSRRKRLAELYA
jgi:hypothetical protein